jgi:hypothetical protein
MVTDWAPSKMDDEGVMTEPAVVSEPGSAVTQPIPVVAELCSQCSAPLVPDQRYCLQCGAPRAHVCGPISGGRPGGPRPSAGLVPGASPGTPHALGSPAGPPSAPPGGRLGQAQPAARNNTLALLAGIGVLLLAIGVGVLIGRAGSGSAKAPPAQVISVGGSPTGASTAPTTSTPTTEAPASSAPKKKETAKAKESSAPGSSITKPAPPSAAKNLRSGGSGQNYEQKSKNLPNVVGT